MSGGASRETWAFRLTTAGSARRLILRRDPPTAPRGGLATEAAVLRAAAAAGVPVPTVVDADDASIVMERVEGETIPRRILRDDRFAGARPRLASQCGAALAAIHRLDADAVPDLPAVDQLEQYERVLRGTGEAHPVFELAFRQLDRTRPASRRSSVVHGDFRNGNLVVDEGGLRAVLDWELAHVGDPLEDLGWLCVRSWRFGAPGPVGGFGTYDELVSAYEEASGVEVDRAALRWWEAVGTLKWGVMCIVQASFHLSGALRSVELAAIGRRVCEVEWDVLRYLR